MYLYIKVIVLLLEYNISVLFTPLLISNSWKFTPLLPSNKYAFFEHHAVMVTAPVKAYVVVIYRPPGQLGDFVHELDTLLSSIPEHECPMLILGDMNIPLDNPNSADFRTLVHSFDLQQVPTLQLTKREKSLISFLLETAPRTT